jgi:hypothetical protein
MFFFFFFNEDGDKSEKGIKTIINVKETTIYTVTLILIFEANVLNKCLQVYVFNILKFIHNYYINYLHNLIDFTKIWTYTKDK